MEINEARRYFALLNARMKPTIKIAAQKAVDYVHSQVPPYPPTLANQRYRRTGRLGRSITTDVRVLGADVVGTIGTNVRYAPDVIGLGKQKPIHENRWWTLEKVVSDNKTRAIEIFEEQLENLL